MEKLMWISIFRLVVALCFVPTRSFSFDIYNVAVLFDCFFNWLLHRHLKNKYLSAKSYCLISIRLFGRRVKDGSIIVQKNIDAQLLPRTSFVSIFCFRHKFKKPNTWRLSYMSANWRDIFTNNQNKEILQRNMQMEFLFYKMDDGMWINYCEYWQEK